MHIRSPFLPRYLKRSMHAAGWLAGDEHRPTGSLPSRGLRQDDGNGGGGFSETVRPRPAPRRITCAPDCWRWATGTVSMSASLRAPAASGRFFRTSGSGRCIQHVQLTCSQRMLPRPRQNAPAAVPKTVASRRGVPTADAHTGFQVQPRPFSTANEYRDAVCAFLGI